jgi:hypothetical protein
MTTIYQFSRRVFSNENLLSQATETANYNESDTHKPGSNEACQENSPVTILTNEQYKNISSEDKKLVTCVPNEGVFKLNAEVIQNNSRLRQELTSILEKSKLSPNEGVSKVADTISKEGFQEYLKELRNSGKQINTQAETIIEQRQQGDSITPKENYRPGNAFDLIPLAMILVAWKSGSLAISKWNQSQVNKKVENLNTVGKFNKVNINQEAERNALAEHIDNILRTDINESSGILSSGVFKTSLHSSIDIKPHLKNPGKSEDIFNDIYIKHLHGNHFKFEDYFRGLNSLAQGDAFKRYFLAFTEKPSREQFIASGLRHAKNKINNP